MTAWPYPRQPIPAFDVMERHALIAETVAMEIEGSANALKMLTETSPRRIAQLEHRVLALRTLARLAGYMSGRVDRLYAIEQPVRRNTNYGETP